MITNLLNELKETWGFTEDQLVDIRDTLEVFGNSCYSLGANDGTLMAQIEISKRFYAKNSDLDGYE